MMNDIENLENILNVIIQFIVSYGFQLVGAIIILVLGWLVAKWVGNLILKLCARTHLDVTLSAFFANVIKTVVLVFVVIIALGKFGITISPFIAALSAVALGSTLALQGPLSNYGSGLLIVLTRPFVVGDTITTQGVTGVVEEIKLAYTQLSNEDGQCITIPNKQIVGEILCNSYSNILVETAILISYRDNPEFVIGILKKVVESNPDVTTRPPPLIGIAKFSDSGIEIGLRYWVPTRKYYEIQYAVNRELYRQIKENGIDIPYPQYSVRMVDKNT
ncbi:MAG: mechanosensitive ion channel family protein [Gammaproteobacteria bacterium]